MSDHCGHGLLVPGFGDAEGMGHGGGDESRLTDGSEPHKDDTVNEIGKDRCRDSKGQPGLPDAAGTQSA